MARQVETWVVDVLELAHPQQIALRTAILDAYAAPDATEGLGAYQRSQEVVRAGVRSLVRDGALTEAQIATAASIELLFEARADSVDVGSSSLQFLPTPTAIVGQVPIELRPEVLVAIADLIRGRADAARSGIRDFEVEEGLEKGEGLRPALRIGGFDPEQMQRRRAAITRRVVAADRRHAVVLLGLVLDGDRIVETASFDEPTGLFGLSAGLAIDGPTADANVVLAAWQERVGAVMEGRALDRGPAPAPDEPLQFLFTPFRPGADASDRQWTFVASVPTLDLVASHLELDAAAVAAVEAARAAVAARTRAVGRRPWQSEMFGRGQHGSPSPSMGAYSIVTVQDIAVLDAMASDVRAWRAEIDARVHDLDAELGEQGVHIGWRRLLSAAWTVHVSSFGRSPATRADGGPRWLDPAPDVSALSVDRVLNAIDVDAAGLDRVLDAGRGDTLVAALETLESAARASWISRFDAWERAARFAHDHRLPRPGPDDLDAARAFHARLGTLYQSVQEAVATDDTARSALRDAWIQVVMSLEPKFSPEEAAAVVDAEADRASLGRTWADIVGSLPPAVRASPELMAAAHEIYETFTTRLDEARATLRQRLIHEDDPRAAFDAVGPFRTLWYLRDEVIDHLAAPIDN